MTRNYKSLIMVGVATLALAACDDSDGIDPVDPTPPPTPTPSAFEDQFGDNFGTAFRVDAKGEAIDPMEGDIIELTLKEDPVDVENQTDGND